MKSKINWNKYQLKVSKERQNQYLDCLIDPSFYGVNRLFVLSFEDQAQRTSCKQYYFPIMKIKYLNVMIDGQNIFYQPVKNNLMTYDIIRKFATGQGDDYTTGCLLDYNYFKKYYKMIVIDLSKHKSFDADQKARKQINFTGNLAQGTVKFF